MVFRIKDWGKFQHFKDRTPPWVKLYRDILDDPDWHELDGQSAKVLTMLWLIASEDETHFGILPCTRKLAFRLRLEEIKVKQILDKLSHWLIQDDINTISERYQVDAPETETETEREKETETEKKRAPRFDAVQHLVSLGVFEQVAKDYCQQRKKKPTMTAIDGIYKQATKAGISLNKALEICCARGWEGFKAEWITENRNDKRTEHQKRQDATARALLGDAYYATPTMKAIEGEVLNEEPPFTRRLG